MFSRLKNKWKVSGLQLLLILCTFAIGGSITGYAGKKIMNALSISQPVLWIIIYILLVTLLWPMAVLLVSFPFGQFRFFTSYLKKIGRRMKIIKSAEQGTGSVLTTRHSRSKAIAIFASGGGSNAQKIIDYFRNSSNVKVSLIVCNKPGAGVLSIAEKEKIPSLLIDKEKFFRGNACINELKDAGIDFIVLAGFLWKIPPALIKAFPSKIINIHPALLPKYGGKGMYGHHVHQAVIDNKEKESGITIHYVDELYDHGKTIFQTTCPVLPGDTADTLAARVLQSEHKHYPEVINQLLS